MKLADYLDIIGYPVIKMLKIKNDYPNEKYAIIIFVVYKFMVNIGNLLVFYYYVKDMTNIIVMIKYFIIIIILLMVGEYIIASTILKSYFKQLITIIQNKNEAI